MVGIIRHVAVGREQGLRGDDDGDITEGEAEQQPAEDDPVQIGRPGEKAVGDRLDVLAADDDQLAGVAFGERAPQWRQWKRDGEGRGGEQARPRSDVALGQSQIVAQGEWRKRGEVADGKRFEQRRGGEERGDGTPVAKRQALQQGAAGARHGTMVTTACHNLGGHVRLLGARAGVSR